MSTGKEPRENSTNFEKYIGVTIQNFTGTYFTVIAQRNDTTNDLVHLACLVAGGTVECTYLDSANECPEHMMALMRVLTYIIPSKPLLVSNVSPEEVSEELQRFGEELISQTITPSSGLSILK